MYVPNPMQRANMQLQSQYSQIDALQKQLDQLRNMANMQFQNQQVMQQQVIQPQQQMTAQGDPAMFTELIPIDSIFARKKFIKTIKLTSLFTIDEMTMPKYRLKMKSNTLQKKI